MEAIGDLVWRQDARGLCLDANSAFERLTANERSRIVGRRLEDVLGLRLATDLWKPDWPSLQAGCPCTHETWLIIEGAPRLYEITHIPQHSRTGELVQIQSLARDITQRRQQIEQALRDSQRQLADIIDFLPDALLAVDRDKRVIIWNKAIAKMTGIASASMLGHGDYAYTIPFYGERRSQLMDLVFTPDAELERRYADVTREGDTLMAETFCNALYDGHGAWIFAKVAPLRDATGQVVGAMEIMRDITERKHVEAALRRNQEYTRSVLDAITEAVFIHDAASGRIIDVNLRACELYGYTREDVLGCDVGQLSQGAEPYDQRHALMWLQRACAEGPQSFDWLAKNRAGETFWVEVNIRFAVISGEERCIVTCRDIRARKQNETRLRQYESMITAMSDAVALIDPQYRYLIVNDEYLHRTGLSREHIRGHTIAELLGESVFHSLIKERFDRCLNGEVGQYQAWFDLPVRGRRFLDVRYAPYLDEAGQIRGVISSSRDITELKHLEEDLRRLTRLDPLTQLFNRRYFFTLAEQEYQRFRRYHRPMALCMIDIDHFKAVNDQYGHLIGDSVLCAVAETLRDNLRQVDILARYGGEEFVILWPETDLATARTSAERLRAAVAGRRIDTPEGAVSVTLSLGVVAIDDGQAETLERLLAVADQMLYRAKQMGRNRVVLWDLGHAAESAAEDSDRE